MMINEEIDQIHLLLAMPPTAVYDALFCRMYAWGLLSLLNNINEKLGVISNRLDTSISADAISIDFNKYCDMQYWSRLKFIDLCNRNWGYAGHQSEINKMTDYLPNGLEEYDVTPDVIGSFRTSMHQLCDEDRISSRSLVYALEKGIETMTHFLFEIERKETNPQPHLYSKLWEDIMTSHDYDWYVINYSEWHQDIGKPTIEDLKAKQKQEIYNLIKTGFLRHAKNPTGGEVKKRKLVIGEDDLEVGSEIDRQFEVECAKLDRLIEMKEELILSINAERMGQYIYKNYTKLTEDDFFVIWNFDQIMDLINEDMAKLKPNLAQYLKRYQEHQDEELLKDIKKIFEPFKEYLKDEIRPTLINEYLEMLLFDSDVKEEAKKKLSNASKKKYCCSIVRALTSTFIFKVEYNNSNNDLAKALHDGFLSDNKETFVRYLKDKDNNNKSLTSWTNKIMDDLKEHPFSRLESGQFDNTIT